MLRPSLRSTTPHQRAVGRNLALDTIASVGVGVTVALVTTLLPTIARRGGLDPIGLAALAAAPYVANLLGAFAGRVGPRSRRQLALIRAAGAGSLLAARGRRLGADDDRGVGRLLAEPLAEQPVLPAAVGNHVSLPDPRSGRRLPGLRPGRGGRARRARGRHPGGPDRWRDGRRDRRTRGPDLRDRLHRPSLTRHRGPTWLLGPRIRSERCPIGRSCRGSPLPRVSTAAA